MKEFKPEKLNYMSATTVYRQFSRSQADVAGWIDYTSSGHHSFNDILRFVQFCVFLTSLGKKPSTRACAGEAPSKDIGNGCLVVRLTTGSWQNWGHSGIPAIRLRPTAFNLTDFGGVGDGRTLNTKAFEKAVAAIEKLREPGVWLTAPFNLTLFLQEGAVILCLADENYFPIMAPLPSYGTGREQKGPQYWKPDPWSKSEGCSYNW